MLTTSAFGGGSDVLRAWEPLSLYRWLFNRQVREGQAHSAVRTRRGVLSRLGRALLVPDVQVSWMPAAFVRGLRYLRADRCDLIYSSFPPASAHLLALLLQRATGLPWVADFRDSWIFDPLDTHLERDTRRKAVEARIERRVVASASAVVVASQEAADYLRTTYAQHADKVRVVSNGFDGEWSDLDAQPSPSGPLRLVHTGSFSYSHPRRSPQVLFAALERLQREDEGWAKRINVVLVGALSADEEAAAAPLQHSGMVHIAGVVERAESLAIQQTAHVLLVVDHVRPWTSTNIPSKVYEYLALRRPILSLGGSGAVGRLVAEMEAGMHVLGDDVEAVCAALVKLCDAHERGELPTGADEKALRPFHRRALTRVLANCFDEVIESAGPCS